MAEYVVVDKGSGNKKEDGHTVLEINKIKNVVDLIDFLQRRSALESQSRSIRKMSSIFTIKDYGYLFVLAIKEALGFEFFVVPIANIDHIYDCGTFWISQNRILHIFGTTQGNSGFVAGFIFPLYSQLLYQRSS